jgi:hypothetical protein
MGAILFVINIKVEINFDKNNLDFQYRTAYAELECTSNQQCTTTQQPPPDDSFNPCVNANCGAGGGSITGSGNPSGSSTPPPPPPPPPPPADDTSEEEGTIDRKEQCEINALGGSNLCKKRHRKTYGNEHTRCSQATFFLDAMLGNCISKITIKRDNALDDCELDYKKDVAICD